jgi:CHAD domain-containing protein
MPYRFLREEAPGEGARRIARKQIDRALRELADPSAPSARRIHQARLCCKKLRALLRLVRPAMEDVYRRENAVLRDAARLFSKTRDRKIFGDVCDELLAQDIRTSSDPEQAEEKTMVAFCRILKKVRSRSSAWPGPDADTLRSSLIGSWRKTRKAMKKARKTEDDKDWHEWRKRSKYLGYHLQLLRDFLPSKLKKLRKRMEKLSDRLGKDHDLVVFCSMLQSRAKGPPDENARARLSLLAAARREKLRKQCLRLGDRLLDDSPKKFNHRLGCLR